MNRTLLMVATALIVLGVVASNAATINVAHNGKAYSNRPLYGNWDISMILDGDRNSVLHADTAPEPGFAYSVDLGKNYPVSEIKIYPRQDNCCPERLKQIRVSVNSDDGTGNIGAEVWGTDLFTDGSNAGSAPGTVVVVTLAAPQNGRWVQIKSLADPVPDYSLQMTEVEVYADAPAVEVNRAFNAVASSNRGLFGTQTINQVVDGNRATVVYGTNSQPAGFAYFINLGLTNQIDHIVIWARQDFLVAERLSNYRVSVHKDNGGQIGDLVWKANLHTDGSNPGSGPGSNDVLTASLDATGDFKGQWIQILSLDDPVPDNALQISEVEVYGVPEAGVALLISRNPESTSAGVGQTATFAIAAIAPGGDPAQITYQWQKEGVNIDGATNTSYTTPPVLLEDAGKKFRCVASYPGLPSQTSAEATVRLNLAFQTKAYSNRPLWAPGGWNISLLVNGDRAGTFHGDTAIDPGMAYQVDLGASVNMQEIVIYPRQDGCCPERLRNIQVSVHTNNNDQIGGAVWSAALFTDGSNAGSGPGAKVSITAALDAVGKFEGQWIQILSLEDPEPDYTMQMNELEVYGAYTGGNPVLQVVQPPADYGTVPGRTARFSIVAKVVNGNPGNLTYQWQRDGANIPGATSTNYVTGPLTEADNGAKFRCVISYAGTANLVSTEATLSFDYNYAKGQPAFSNRPLWGPGGWNISMIVDGNRANVVHGDTTPGEGFAYTINLGEVIDIEKIDIYPRQDTCCPERLANIRVSVHKDNTGQLGDQVWSADLFTAGDNAGSGPGVVVDITKDADPAGTFRGQWVRILALDDPVPDYFLQMTEVEVYGRAVLAEPLASLAAIRSSNNLTLTWQTNFSGYTLESADTLPSPVWNAVGGVVSNSVTITIGAGTKYYRLKK